MAEVNVVKETRPERRELEPFFSDWAPLFRGSLFGVSPFGLMRRFTEDMDRIFGEARFTMPEVWRPVIEVKEQAGKLLVTAELPGVQKEDVKVNVAENVLTLEGERKQEKEEKREGYFHSERSYGKFSRSIALPEGANIDQAHAEFNNGILAISVPIAEKKEKLREIPVSEAPKAKSTAG